MSGKITKPGAYAGIPAETYHGDWCDGPSISASGLRTILLDCPARYFAGSYLNPRRVEKVTPALSFGRAAHALALGEPTFNAEFVLSPFDEFRTKEAKAWRDAQTKTIIREEELQRIRSMCAQIDLVAPNAFRSGTPEMSFAWRDKQTGLWLKCRPDFMPDEIEGRYVPEYKTARSVMPRKFSAAAFDLGYDIQAALMLDGIEAVTGKRPLGVLHIAQEKQPPFILQPFILTPDQIEIGRRRYRAALEIFARCLALHINKTPPHLAWPGYASEPVFLETPRWLLDASTTETAGDSDDDGIDSLEDAA